MQWKETKAGSKHRASKRIDIAQMPKTTIQPEWRSRPIILSLRNNGIRFAHIEEANDPIANIPVRDIRPQLDDAADAAGSKRETAGVQTHIVIF